MMLLSLFTHATTVHGLAIGGNVGVAGDGTEGHLVAVAEIKLGAHLGVRTFSRRTRLCKCFTDALVAAANEPLGARWAIAATTIVATLLALTGWGAA